MTAFRESRARAPRNTAATTKSLASAGKALSAWYRKSARQLPWRESRNPYFVWVSEVMLQQTRVETAIPYFERFARAFPSVEALATAAEADVLAHWSGLGYYERARRLHQAAGIVLCNGSGLPETAHELALLPGIGAYTSAAIASIAFRELIPAVDGNVERVLSRWLAMRGPSSAAAKLRIRDTALALLNRVEPGLSNQALMDVGALICTPKNPRCGECPLAGGCRARALGRQDRLPLSRKRTARRRRPALAVMIRRGDKVLLCRREESSRWMPGLWEIPWSPLPARAGLRLAEQTLERTYGVEISVGRALGSVRHTITANRFDVEIRRGSVRGRLLGLGRANATIGWFAPGELSAIPHTGLTARLLRQPAPVGD